MRFKRKKVSRMRGKTTHGWGAKKKRRGYGNRGGKGLAGSGKRADSKKPSLWQNTQYFGKHGFTKKNIKETINPINILDIEEKVDVWVNEKLAEKKEGFYLVNLEKVGYNKLLSTGKPHKKIKIEVKYASKGAVESAKAGGWELVVTHQKIKKVKKEKPAEKKEEKKGSEGTDTD